MAREGEDLTKSGLGLELRCVTGSCKQERPHGLVMLPSAEERVCRLQSTAACGKPFSVEGASSGREHGIPRGHVHPEWSESDESTNKSKNRSDAESVLTGTRSAEFS